MRVFKRFPTPASLEDLAAKEQVTGFGLIEKMYKKSVTHRCILDQDTAFVTNPEGKQ